MNEKVSEKYRFLSPLYS